MGVFVVRVAWAAAFTWAPIELISPADEVAVLQLVSQLPKSVRALAEMVTGLVVELLRWDSVPAVKEMATGLVVELLRRDSVPAVAEMVTGLRVELLLRDSEWAAGEMVTGSGAILWLEHYNYGQLVYAPH